MEKILFINHTLELGGGEKYLKELVDFSLANNLEPTIIIPNRLNEEYYDEYFKSKGVEVLRFPIYNKQQLLRYFYTKNAFYNIFIRYRLAKRFKLVHFINIGSASSYYRSFRHPKKKFWHIGNAIQYNDHITTFAENIFENEMHEVICINEYQVDEIKSQYNVKCKISLFKLFLND